MLKQIGAVKNQKLPHSFRRLLWSYDFNSLDVEKNKKTIVLNGINYGNLSEWRWLVGYYGRREVKKILDSVKESAVRPGAKKLASLLIADK